MTDAEVSRHLDAAGELWMRRSERIWTLDLSMLTEAGVTFARPNAADARRAAAGRELRAARREVVVSAPRPPSAMLPTPPPPAGPAATRGEERLRPVERRGWFRWIVGR